MHWGIFVDRSTSVHTKKPKQNLHTQKEKKIPRPIQPFMGSVTITNQNTCMFNPIFTTVVLVAGGNLPGEVMCKPGKYINDHLAVLDL